jgi:signal transduction histidine kinase
MLLETCQRQHELPPPAKETLDDVIQKLRSAVDDGRRVIRGVRPSVLDDLGIVAAIEDLVERCGRDGLVVRFTYGPTSGLRKTHELTLYRIAQEALNNVKKHSGAGEAEIDLRQIDGRVTLAVRDFGRGFDVRKPRLSGFGVLGMTERVRLAGGQCVVESRPGAGTTVIAELPASSAGESDSQAPGSLKPEPQATEPLTPELRRLEPPALPALDSQTSAADFDASRPTSLEAATSLSAPRTGAPTVSGAG